MTITLLPFTRSSFPKLYPYSRILVPRPLSCGRPRFNSNDSGRSGSAKLFADAEREEAEERANESQRRASAARISFLENKDSNWNGEESMQDAVLRMLVDKYKPLRSGTVRTAEEKIRQLPPSVHMDSTNISEQNSTPSLAVPPLANWEALANQPLLPAVEGHRPWLTTYKVPSHAETSIRLGRFPPPVSARPATHSSPEDERARRKVKEVKKRKEVVGRLTGAKESAMDYRLGINRSAAPRQGRPMPVSLKGWATLVEDKIERARQAGQFSKLSGRGKPLERHHNESNPFIGREEFLLNRIVQRNGAAPPWVELQGELENAVITFREILRQSWTRRALRMLTYSQPASSLPLLTPEDIAALRDPEWETRERSYHNTAVDDLNSFVRKYNGQAPYAVRRPYHELSTELEKAYQDSAPDILRGIEERINKSGLRAGGASADSERLGSAELNVGPPLRIRDVIREWLFKLTGR